jgi:hypothetical protein
MVAGVQGVVAGGTSSGQKKTDKNDLTESQIREIFSLAEGPFDAIKGLAGKAASKAAQIGKNLSNKVTSDKLEKLWNAAGKPTSSDGIIKILRKGGIADDLIKNALINAGVDREEVEKEMGGETANIAPPFKSGIEAMDKEAEKIFREKGKDAFVAYWEKVVSDNEQAPDTAQKPATSRSEDPIGTVVNRKLRDPKTGKEVSVQLKKVGPNKWQNLNDPSSPPFTPKTAFAKSADLRENSSSGSTSSGSIASVASGLGGPMMPVIRRMPAGQSFFGPAGTVAKKAKKKRSKQ